MSSADAGHAAAPPRSTDPVLSAAELTALLNRFFSDYVDPGVVVERVDRDGVHVRMDIQPMHLRPGGTISGPTQMTICDIAMYMAVNALLGPTPMAVTADMTMHFMRRPAGAVLRADGRVLRLGRSLAVCEVSVYTDDPARPVSHAIGSYALPRDARG